MCHCLIFAILYFSKFYNGDNIEIFLLDKDGHDIGSRGLLSIYFPCRSITLPLQLYLLSESIKRHPHSIDWCGYSPFCHC